MSFEHAVLVERSERFKLPQLQLRELGLEHVPAVPVDIGGVLDGLVMLGIRAKQGEQAYQGLTKAFTIGHVAAWDQPEICRGDTGGVQPIALT